MSTAELKMDLISKIDVLDEQQLQELSEMVNHLINGDGDEWNEPVSLSKIDRAIKEANNGQLRPVGDVLREIRRKYGFHG